MTVATLTGKKVPCPIHNGAHDLVLEPSPESRKRIAARCGDRIVFTTDADKTIAKIRALVMKV